MATKVIMPQLGESVVEGTISFWLKKEGESVQEYEPLLEVSTDKVTTEIPAPASGTVLEIYVGENETVAAGTLLCLIGAVGEQQAAPTQKVEEKSSNGQHVTPVVARMVAEHNIDLSLVRGSGQGGRVTKKDIEAHLAGARTALPPWEQPGSGDLFKPTEAPLPTGGGATSAAASAATSPAPRLIPVEPIPASNAGELIPLNPMRRAIAEHMVRSKLQTAPHVTTVMEADMTTVLAHLEANKPHYAKQGVNLTLTAYFVRAMVAACGVVPVLNSTWREDGIWMQHGVHVGMAVALDEGLIVPVIHHAEDLNLVGTARRVNDLATRARNKQLKPDEIQGGTISLSNHGVSGSLLATPIINQPQSAILGVGLMEKRVKVIQDALAIRPCCYLSLTFDHRVADGAQADGWLYAVKNALENWSGE